MSRGFATIKGWLDIAEEAYYDGERKTCEDMLREAYNSLKLFKGELTPAMFQDLAVTIKALVRLLNEGLKRPATIH